MSDSQWPHGLQPTRLLCPWDFPGKSTRVGCHCLLWICFSLLPNSYMTASLSKDFNFLQFLEDITLLVICFSLFPNSYMTASLSEDFNFLQDLEDITLLSSGYCWEVVVKLIGIVFQVNFYFWLFLRYSLCLWCSYITQCYMSYISRCKFPFIYSC